METTGKAKGRKAEIDLNAHPLAGVLREAILRADDLARQIEDDPDFALDAIQDQAIVRDAETSEVLEECAAYALAGLAAEQRKGAADGR